MSRSERIVLAVFVVTMSCLAASACSLADGACLRMSDCNDGLSCVEGACIAPRSATAATAALAPGASDASVE